MKRYNKVIATVISLSGLLLWSVDSALGHMSTDPNNIWQGWGTGHMTFGIIPMVFFWLALIVFVLFLSRRGAKDASNNAVTQEQTALEILKQRFARGEIDKQEFEEAKRILAD